MAVGSQCGEDAVFDEFFGDKSDGFVVDVGAADGKDNSNSWNRINKGWSAILWKRGKARRKQPNSCSGDILRF